MASAVDWRVRVPELSALTARTRPAACWPLETSTELCSVALLRGGELFVEEALAENRHSEMLLPMIRRVLERSRLAPRQMDAFAFGQGPGAFTGLRTACAVAQGLAFGLDKPVLAVDSLMLVAEDARTQGAGDDVWVAMDARIGEIYAAHYRWADAAWAVVEGPALYRPETLAARRGAPFRCVTSSTCWRPPTLLTIRRAERRLREPPRASGRRRTRRGGR